MPRNSLGSDTGGAPISDRLSAPALMNIGLVGSVEMPLLKKPVFQEFYKTEDCGKNRNGEGNLRNQWEKTIAIREKMKKTYKI